MRAVTCMGGGLSLVNLSLMHSEPGLAPRTNSNHRKSLPEPGFNRHGQKGRFRRCITTLWAIGACVGVCGGHIRHL